MGEPRCSPRSGVVPVTSGSCLTRMRRARRTARRQGHSAPAQRHGRVGRRDKPRRCAPHRAEREGNSGPETKGGSRVGNIRVTRCRLDPGHARVPRPITVRPGRARGLGRRGLARRGGGRGPWGSAAWAGAPRLRRSGPGSRGACGPGGSCCGRAAGPAGASLRAPRPPLPCGPLGEVSVAPGRGQRGGSRHHRARARRSPPRQPLAREPAGGRRGALCRPRTLPWPPWRARDSSGPRQGQAPLGPAAAPLGEVPGRSVTEPSCRAAPFVVLALLVAVRTSTASFIYFPAAGRRRLSVSV